MASDTQRTESPRRQWLVRVWSYSLTMAVGLSLIATLLTGDLLLSVPVAGVCLVCGCVGTVLGYNHE